MSPCPIYGGFCRQVRGGHGRFPRGESASNSGASSIPAEGRTAGENGGSATRPRPSPKVHYLSSSSEETPQLKRRKLRMRLLTKSEEEEKEEEEVDKEERENQGDFPALSFVHSPPPQPIGRVVTVAAAVETATATATEDQPPLVDTPQLLPLLLEESAHRALLISQLAGRQDPLATGPSKGLSNEEEQEAMYIRLPSYFGELPISKRLSSFETFTTVSLSIFLDLP